MMDNEIHSTEQNVRITLRKATPADLELLQMWDEQPHVIACDPNSDWGWEVELHRSPGWREQLIAELDGVPIGFLQIIDPAREETHYWGKIDEGYRAIDIWIGMEENLSQGYGTEMMKLALRRCFSVGGVDAVLIDPLASNTQAHKFYSKLGFEFLEARLFDEDECFVFILERGRYEALESK